MSTASIFRSSELGLAMLVAVLLEGGILAGLAIAGGSKSLAPDVPEPRELVPIQVTPVIDDLPLLKLGSKAKAKLPDMWRKPPPQAPRYEDKSAPSTKADKQLPKEAPKTELAKPNETPAPPSAEVAKQVDAPVPTEAPPPEKEQTMPQEGSNDGVKEGTEVDPLKAMVVDQYRMKIIAWFKSGFTVPPGVDCETLQSLVTRVRVQVGSDRSVSGFTITGESGNEVFDARVKAHMERKVGQELPPPPPKYPDILEAIVLPSFSGKNSSCKGSSGGSKPAEAPPAAEPQENPGSTE